MSEVKRWEPRNTAVGFDMQPLPDGSFVLITDFDAEHALRLEAENYSARFKASLRDALDRAEAAERKVEKLRIACDKEFADVQLLSDRNFVLERQVGELREQLQEASVRQAQLQAMVSDSGLKLDTAMELMLEIRSGTHPNHIKRIDAFLNTTSTEGKDHE